MAGHSKWANIRFRKAAQDKKRGKIFTKLIREITIAAREGGDDLSSNPRLRAAVDKAYASNMNKDTVERAVKRGAGGDEGADVFEIRYEGYGVGGVAVMVDCMTDNRNRTVAEVRHVFSKCHGNLGTDGSVAYLFSKQGQLFFPPGSDEDRIIEAALEADAEDVVVEAEGAMQVVTSAEQFINVKEALASAGFVPDFAELTMVAATQVEINDLEAAEKHMKLIDMLEDLDDVQVVHSNAEIADAIADQLE